MDNREGEILHDRSTLGESLSAEEERRLAAWYASLDALESTQLGLEEPTENRAAETGFLRTQVNATLSRIAQATERIREITSQNDALRREIALLHQRLDSLASRAV